MATTINAGRVAMVPKGAWSNATEYSRLDVVTYQGSSYVSKADENEGNNPSSATTYWQLLASGVDTSNYYTESEVDTLLAGKQDKDYVISLSGSGTTSSPYTINKTFSEISTAYNAGKTLILSDGSCVSNFTCYQGYRFIFHRFVENDRANVIQYSIMTDSSVVKVEYELQEALVSGSSIKTVNGASVLGSGNISTKEILTLSNDLPSVGTAVNSDDYTLIETAATNGMLVQRSGVVYYLYSSIIGMPPNGYAAIWAIKFNAPTDVMNIGFSMVGYAIRTSDHVVTKIEIFNANAKQDALVSGTNIKTINNTSLLGSGNIAINGIASITTQQDGTAVITVASGDTYTINLNHVHNKSVTSSTDATITLDEHIIYDLGTVAGNKTINLPTTVDAGAEYEFRLAYTSGTISGTAISGTTVANNATLTFTAGKTYQVIISGGILYYSETTVS